MTARVVSSEPAADLSLLQLDRVPPGAEGGRMADSSAVHVGDQVIIVGAPYGLSYPLSVGYISARWPPNTVYNTMPLAEFFQTDATINTGNSGGPMFNMKGEVIGIVSHNISKGGGSEGLGFVVTLNTAKQLLLEKRSFWTGLEGIVLSDSQADLLNLPPRASGFIVKTVAKGSPGDEIGLRGSTQIVNIGGEEVPLGGRHHPVGRRHSDGRRESGQDPGHDEQAACRRAVQGEHPPRGPGARADRQGAVTLGEAPAGVRAPDGAPSGRANRRTVWTGSIDSAFAAPGPAYLAVAGPIGSAAPAGPAASAGGRGDCGDRFGRAVAGAAERRFRPRPLVSE